MKRIYIKDTAEKAGEEVSVLGWVNIVRVHGKVIFIDLRDITGIIQVVVTPDNKEAYEIAKEVRPEWVLKITGKINERPGKMANDKIATGKIELPAQNIEVLSKAKTLPFEVSTEGYDVGEEVRMKYRYLDIRRERIRNNLLIRDKVLTFVRDFLHKNNFVEVETPILTKSTPEGARDFVVPSRTEPGKFYALPQSPQQYKQLLMVGGLERYFQIAKCLRDEDPRGDRQPEFTQIDMEMSFMSQEEVMNLNEEMIINCVKTLFPEKKIMQIPFPRLSYKEAMEKYKTDRPDLRKDKDELAFCWVIDFPFFEKSDNGWTFTHNPFSAPKPEWIESLAKKENIGDIVATQYDMVLNGFEIGGGSLRNYKPEALQAVFEIMGYEEKEIKEKFGHMLEAFEYGAPPHGGIAYGFDRLIAILTGEPNIREVIAFPKTGDGRDLMMKAPDEISKEQLKELKLKK